MGTVLGLRLGQCSLASAVAVSHMVAACWSANLVSVPTAMLAGGAAIVAIYMLGS
jgi:hypothetical protein